MKKFRRPLIAAGALVAAAALLLTGCAAQPSTAKAKDVTITWWSWNPSNDTVKPYIAAFEKAHPDIKVDYKFIENSDYANALKLSLTSGAGPDVFGLQQGVWTDEFAPLSENLEPYATKNLGTDWKNNILQATSMSSGSKLVAIPWDVLGAGNLFYNKTMFDKLGLTFPKTYSQLLSVCKSLKAAGDNCMEQGAMDSWQNLDLIQTIANQVSTGYIYKAIDGTKPFNSPTMITALTAYKKLFTDGVIQPGALGMAAYPDAENAFLEGKAGMILFGTWSNSYVSKTGLAAFAKTNNVPQLLKTDLFPVNFPAVVSNAKTGTVFGGPDVGWGMSASSKHKDAAWTLIQFLTASKVGQTIQAKTLNQPSLKSVSIDMSQVKSTAQEKAVDAQAAELAKPAGSRQILNADVQTALGNALSAVAAGTQSPADAAKAVQTVIDSSK
jgi:raffinose/stachyose/melibiose transport system substrate-binding protein